VGLPAGGSHNVGEGRAIRLLEHAEDDRLLAALARRGRAFVAGGGPGGLGFFGATVAALGAGVGVSAWMAFQIRLTAVLRSVNFLIGFRRSKGTTPAKAFQTSANRLMGHSAESLANSFSVVKWGWPSGA
jgi:hypothetical protein